MNYSKLFLIIGIIMFIIMIFFIFYALRHPEGSFRLKLSTTYLLYFLYLLVMVGMFLISFINRKKQ